MKFSLHFYCVVHTNNCIVYEHVDQFLLHFVPTGIQWVAILGLHIPLQRLGGGLLCIYHTWGIHKFQPSWVLGGRAEVLFSPIYSVGLFLPGAWVLSLETETTERCGKDGLMYRALNLCSVPSFPLPVWPWTSHWVSLCLHSPSVQWNDITSQSRKGDEDPYMWGGQPLWYRERQTTLPFFIAQRSCSNNFLLLERIAKPKAPLSFAHPFYCQMHILALHMSIDTMG